MIVAGHTRVAACKALGWTEIPDERIDYCDGMTPEQVRAYRIADNKTGDIATYNVSMLKSEVAGIKGLDMSRFNCDFKGKARPYGAERLRGDRVWNLRLCNIDDCAGEWQMPTLEPVDLRPDDLIPFNFCKSADKFDAGVHFCIDDYQFERVWNSPERYIELLRRFQCVVCPDFSIYLDMPLPMKLWNLYRSRALGHWWQRQGLTVIPNVTWSGLDSLDYCLDGIPHGGTVFVSTVGVTRDRQAAEIVRRGFEAALETIGPSRVLMLGRTPEGVDCGDVEVVEYETKSFKGGRK